MVQVGDIFKSKENVNWYVMVTAVGSQGAFETGWSCSSPQKNMEHEGVKHFYNADGTEISDYGVDLDLSKNYRTDKPVQEPIKEQSIWTL